MDEPYLPLELLYLICEYLNGRGIKTFMQVSKRIYNKYLEELRNLEIHEIRYLCFHNECNIKHTQRRIRILMKFDNLITHWYITPEDINGWHYDKRIKQIIDKIERDGKVTHNLICCYLRDIKD